MRGRTKGVTVVVVIAVVVIITLGIMKRLPVRVRLSILLQQTPLIEVTLGVPLTFGLQRCLALCLFPRQAKGETRASAYAAVHLIRIGFWRCLMLMLHGNLFRSSLSTDGVTALRSTGRTLVAVVVILVVHHGPRVQSMLALEMF
jgi:hypothetical protein